MTVAEICVNAYLIVGLLAAVLIWTTLIASKPEDNKTEEKNHDLSRASLYRERNT